MRKRIRQMARGKFEYGKPVLSLSCEHIEFEVPEGTEETGEFVISSQTKQNLRGVVYSTEARMECLSPQFDGEENRIHYRFHSRGLKEGEVVTGQFVIVFNQDEYSLNFRATITKNYASASTGVIKNLTDFAELAKANWQEAYQLFYHKSFPNVIKPEQSDAWMVYKGIISAKPCNQNLEEFLIGIQKKKPIHFQIEQNAYNYEQINTSLKETISVKKDEWGFIELDIESDSDFLLPGKSRITTDDFIGSTCLFDVFIQAEKLHAGYNYGVIRMKGVYETVTCTFSIHNGSQGSEEHKLFENIKECKAGIMELYQAYRLKRIVTGVWANETIDILNHLHAVQPEEPLYLLMKAQALIINRQRQDAQWILDDFKRDWTDQKAPIWAYYLYLMTLMEREPAYVDRMTHEIETIFRENPDSPMLFWILSFLEEEYYNNNAHKLKAIEYWVLKGNSSPYLYLEAYYLIWQDPYLLSKLGVFELRILRWAIRHKAITKEIAAQIFEIVEAKKNFDPIIFRILEESYRIDPKPSYVGILCSYLIKGQQYDKKYNKWYKQGIELNLRITGLYEAYLFSMDDREISEVPRIIQMYFQYESTISYKKLAVLYNNIIAGKEEDPQMYQQYRRMIGKFSMEHVEAGHMDDNLAVLYTDMLAFGHLNEELARSLANILFSVKVLIGDPKIMRAICYQRQMKDPQIVPVTDGVCYLNLCSDDYMILFEDAKGQRYVGSVSYEVQRLMHPKPYMEKCMELAPNELPYIISYFADKKSHFDFVEKDKKFFHRILFSDDLSMEYRMEIIPEIIRFYQTGEYDGTVKQYLETTDFTIFPADQRRYMTELLVEYHMHQKAFELIERFGIDQIRTAGKVALSTYMIDEISGEEDEFLISLVVAGFEAGKYNEQMLEYLCNYYTGPTDMMYRIWQEASKFELVTFELEERILVQMLYSEHMSEKADQIFQSYYENGGREIVVLAYLSYRGHAYFLKDEKPDAYVFEMIETRYYYKMELNDACKLALLKHLSEKETIDANEYAMEDELLAEYTCRNMNFAFYRNLDERLIHKYHFYDKIFLEHRTNPKNHVVLHYSRDEDGEQFVTEDMPDVYDGIHVKSFVMFFGEMIQYYISEEYKNEVQVTESNRITNNNVYGEQDSSRYNLLNQMLISSTLMDENSLYNSMKQYEGYNELTKKAFKII